MRPSWPVRATGTDLAASYRELGLWDDTTLPSALATHLAGRADLPFRIWSSGQAYSGTIGDVAAAARRLAGALAARGVGSGDVVAFQLPNWVEAAVTFWGAALAGAVLVPIVHIYGPKEVGYVLEHSGARVLVTADRFGHLDYLAPLGDHRRRCPQLELVAVVSSGTGTERLPDASLPFRELLDAAAVEGPAAVDPDQVAVIGFTSGTTADPKGVMHSHRSLLAELRQLVQMQAPSGGRPRLMGSPVCHATGMLGGLLMPVVHGEPLHLIDRWDPGAVLSALVEGDLTAAGGATYFLTSLLDAADFGPEHLARITHVTLGGAPIPAAVADRAHGLGISLARAYGSTEHPSISGGRHDDPVDKRLHTDGRPMPAVEVRIVGTGGRSLPSGHPGEIHSRGPDLFVGYTDPKLTDGATDAAGWYATGDVGVLDDEGYLTITDRLNDVIIRGGENVSAAEVEELLARMPGVAEVAVVAAPDRRLGEHACAFLRVLPDRAPPELEAVRRHLAGAGLARQKWPEELRVVDDFQRTASGKVKKFVLRDQLRRAEPFPPDLSRSED